jgi:hypothetical protein
MNRETYRALTFIGLGLVALNVTQRDWLADLAGEVSDSAFITVREGWGTTLSILATITLAYLWVSSRNSN